MEGLDCWLRDLAVIPQAVAFLRGLGRRWGLCRELSLGRLLCRMWFEGTTEWTDASEERLSQFKKEVKFVIFFLMKTEGPLRIVSGSMILLHTSHSV